MSTISNTLPSYQAVNYNTKTETPEHPIENPDEGNKKIVVEITPGEDNVSSGDRSDNTVNISISTPNREIEAEISRSQVADALYRRTYKNALGGNDDNNKLAKAYVAKNSDLESDDLATMAYLNHKKDLINVYSQGTSHAQSIYGESGQDSSDSNDNNTAAYQYNQAKNAMNKHAFIAGTIDKIS